MKSEFQFAIINVFSNSLINALGNPSAIILLDRDLSDIKLQAIATELNQPATTFLWKTEKENEFLIRWFAPDAEIGLCGHGAMAASVFLSDHFSDVAADNGFKLIKNDTIIEAGLNSENEHFIILKNIQRSKQQQSPEGLEKALGKKIVEYYPTDNKHIVLLENEESLAKMKPDFEALRKIDVFGYSVTAPSSQKGDFVCRTLVPHVQQLEDHATGSTQAVLVDFWANKLEKSKLESRQLSPRGGYFNAIHNAENFKLIAHSYYTIRGTFYLN
ncbi:PhzF family phenazine biosynthesis isomerase [Marivirga salinae]|uniref:PhzF family phenazine biosynthesis isomerase n=1 Tax=Marivirga salinarum TaxID=3059078 RepID=A0AA51N9U1_9BACT|nr:PhzF family phenazine biosynthesis isomerase [Marivirga sp. BDSF4-3]WMN11337.1 PhzF family phenazine biosynthesis isomerase [Marivirga sp. BDSF4-3]